MRKLVLLLCLSTFSCMQEGNNSLLQGENNPLIDIEGNHDIEVARYSYQDGTGEVNDTFPSVFTLEIVSDTSINMILGDTLVFDYLILSEDLSNDTILHYKDDNHPLSHQIRYIDYNTKDNSLVGFACSCFLGGSTSYRWNIQY